MQGSRALKGSYLNCASSDEYENANRRYVLPNCRDVHLIIWDITEQNVIG